LYEPLSVKSQVVAGMNYMVKIQVAPDEYIHVKIYKPLPHTHNPPSISEFHTGKTVEDEL
jgi:cystatin-A/B